MAENTQTTLDQGSQLSAGQNNQPPVSKGFAYECVEKCTYRGRLVKQGEIIYLDKQVDKLPHFKEIKK